MKVAIYSYNSTLLEAEEVESISLPGISGQFCVYPKHIAFFSLLKKGTICVSHREGRVLRVKDIEIKEGIFSVKNEEAIAVVTL